MRQLGVQRSHCADWNWGQTRTPSHRIFRVRKGTGPEAQG